MSAEEERRKKEEASNLLSTCCCPAGVADRTGKFTILAAIHVRALDAFELKGHSTFTICWLLPGAALRSTSDRPRRKRARKAERFRRRPHLSEPSHWPEYEGGKLATAQFVGNVGKRYAALQRHKRPRDVGPSDNHPNEVEVSSGEKSHNAALRRRHGEHN